MEHLRFHRRLWLLLLSGALLLIALLLHIASARRPIASEDGHLFDSLGDCGEFRALASDTNPLLFGGEDTRIFSERENFALPTSCGCFADSLVGSKQ
jgi:hypothetical protein